MSVSLMNYSSVFDRRTAVKPDLQRFLAALQVVCCKAANRLGSSCLV